MTRERYFQGYRRANGSVGVRDLLLALPSVVCANRAAYEAAAATEGAVSVEHPLGCAQIGADKEQTFRTLVGIGAHPNVRHTVVIGLGCEGIAADTVYRAIVATGHSADVLSIQDVGGTTSAATQAAGDLAIKSSPSMVGQRQPVPVEELIVGVGRVDALGATGQAIVEEILDRGGRVLKAVALPTSESLSYAQAFPSSVRLATMEAVTGDSETITGLAAAGAQIVIAQADGQHLGGHPICPVVRIGYDSRLKAALLDDIDGMVQERTVPEWVDFILEVASGKKTAAEALGAQLFAIERVGPTL